MAFLDADSTHPHIPYGAEHDERSRRLVSATAKLLPLTIRPASPTYVNVNHINIVMYDA